METMNEEEAALLRDRLITSTMKMNKAHRNIMNGKISPMEMCTQNFNATGIENVEYYGEKRIYSKSDGP